MALDISVFKAYDIRGVYPTQLDEKGVYDVAHAYTEVIKPKKVVITRDVREHGPALQKALIQGFTDAGVDVIDGGLVSTDMLYFAVATLGVDGGITISASHNSREWNGLNLTRKNAEPISGETGMNEIKELALKGHRVEADKKGVITEKNFLDDYARYILSLVDISKIPKVKMVGHNNCGYQATVMKRIIELGSLPIEFSSIYGEPDGTFPIPHGHPSPQLPDNRIEIEREVKKQKADLGVSWDADGDRCFFIDENGNFIEGYFTTAVLAKQILSKNPGQKVIIDPRLVWASIDSIKEAGGTPIITKPGMTLIAARMKQEGAIFAGEMSSHFYFPETFYRDNGILPIFKILELMSESGKKLSEIYDPYLAKYFTPGELNFTVSNKDEIIKRAEEKYSDGKIEYIDGLSVEYPDWRFNLRKSNTEPLLRLNIEAQSQNLLDEEKKELISIIY
jgi:phosphomannomutase